MVGLLLAMPAGRAASPWPAAESDLPPDPQLVAGTLDNGLRFLFLPNAEPKGRICLRLLVAVGSLQERDGEEGLAHLVEHLVCHGSAAHPGDALARMLEQHGIGTGSDSNAFTGQSSTIYHLDLPDNTPATLEMGLSVLREYAAEAAFDPAALAVERKIVLSEKADRAGLGRRIMDANFSLLWPNSRAARRSPIGIDAVIERGPREALVAFYDAWYRPERMAVVVVGDVTRELVEPAVRRQFAALAARGPAREEPPDLSPAAAAPPNVKLLFDSDQTGAALAFEHPFPSPRQPDTHARRVEQLRVALSFAMFQDRLNRFSHQHKGTFGSPQVLLNEPVLDWLLPQATVMLDLRTWESAAMDFEQLHRSAFTYGFTPDELRVAKANFAMSYEQAVRSVASRPSPWLADRLAGGLLGGTILTTPAALRDDLAAEIERTTAEDCLAAFRRTWSAQAMHVLVVAHPQFHATAADVGRVLNSSRQHAVEKPNDPGYRPLVYDLGPPGELVRDNRVADLDLHLAEFGNGVRFNFKATNFTADSVDVVVRVGHGLLSMPRDRPGLNLLANHALMAGGLTRHTTQELNDLLAGHALQVRFYVDSDACVFFAQCAPRELPLSLQLIAACLTNSAYRPEALTDAQAGFSSLYSALQASPVGPIPYIIENLLAGGDNRFGVPVPTRLFGYAMHDLSPWLEAEFKQGPIEMAVVGDVAWDEALAAAAQTLGALPDRRFAAPLADEPSLPRAPHLRSPLRYLSGTTVQQGGLAWCWPVTAPNEIHRERRLHLLAQVIADRLRHRVREELGATYSPAAAYVMHEGFPTFNYLVAYLEVPPAQIDKVTRVVEQEIAALRARPLSAEEFAASHQPVFRAREDEPRTNVYWCHTVLRDAQQHPDRLTAARDRSADFAAITPAEIQALAKQFLNPKTCFVFQARPETRKPAPAPAR